MKGRSPLCGVLTVYGVLQIARATAYVTYPMIIAIFVTKANNLRTLLQRTYLSVFIPFYDLHNLHVAAGYVCTFAGIVHTIVHFVRWALQVTISIIDYSWTH